MPIYIFRGNKKLKDLVLYFQNHHYFHDDRHECSNRQMKNQIRSLQITLLQTFRNLLSQFHKEYPRPDSKLYLDSFSKARILHFWDLCVCHQ